MATCCCSACTTASRRCGCVGRPQYGIRARRRSLGLVTRLLRAPLRRVRSPRDIFVIGFLFGLGFDTATTIGLLLLAVSVSAAGIPW